MARAAGRHRVWPWLVGAAGLVLVLGGGLVAADLWARHQVTTVAEQRIAQLLALPAGQTVDVDLAPGSMLVQLGRGRIDSLSASIDGLALGELVGDVHVELTGIPVELSRLVRSPDAVISGAVDSVTLTYAATEASVTAIAKTLSASTVQSVAFDAPYLRLASSWDIFLLGRVNLGMSLEPSVDDGALSFTPIDVSVNNDFYDVEQFRQTFGGLLDVIFQPRSVCVAEYLPAGVDLVSAEIVGDSLQVVLTAQGLGLDAESLATRGSCG